MNRSDFFDISQIILKLATSGAYRLQKLWYESDLIDIFKIFADKGDIFHIDLISLIPAIYGLMCQISY